MTTIIPYQAHRAVRRSDIEPLVALRVNVHTVAERCVVQLAGELDLATRAQVIAASTTGNHPKIVIDLTDLTFMDCSGFGSLVEARLLIEGGGRSFAVRGATGQPAHLLDLIASATGTSRIDDEDPSPHRELRGESGLAPLEAG